MPINVFAEHILITRAGIKEQSIKSRLALLRAPDAAESQPGPKDFVDID